MHSYLNNHIISNANLRIDFHDRGLLLADGLFETIKIEDKNPLYLNEHLERLGRGAELLKIPHDLTLAKITEVTDKLIKVNQFSEKILVARLTLTRGPGSRGLLPPAEMEPTVLMTICPYQELSEQPIKLCIASNRRNEYSSLSNIKSLSYTENVLGKMEAVQKGADDALFLNTKGFVASTSCANIFIVENGVWITPPLTDGVLPGIIRGQILTSGRPCEERSLSLEECLHADEIFVTNSLMGVKKAELTY